MEVDGDIHSKKKLLRTVTIYLLDKLRRISTTENVCLVALYNYLKNIYVDNPKVVVYDRGRLLDDSCTIRIPNSFFKDVYERMESFWFMPGNMY